ncbi:MAG: polyphosphate kinase 2 family protein [Acidobacteriota bacterium]
MKRFRIEPGQRVHLKDFDPEDTSVVRGGKKAGAKKTAELQERLLKQQELLYASHSHKLLIVLQGMDTSGKDGTVRHVMSAGSPLGVRVTSFKKPTVEELDHDYLWRVHKQAPESGEIAIFNRSHYEDVLVVRVHALVPDDPWKQRYREIKDFERMLTEQGTTILKFFLHISPDEQKKRLQERLDDPEKQWKFQHGDLTERKLWDDYMKAYEDALTHTSTDCAPWYVVPSNAKWFRNYVISKTIVAALERLEMKYPQPDLAGITID